MYNRVSKDIKKAITLNSSFYSDKDSWDKIKEVVFAKQWQYIGDRDRFFRGPENVVPLWILENYLDEPVLLVQEGDELKCISNVCTHRGFVMIDHPQKLKTINCAYHGRRFGLDGQFQFMPEFKDAEDFPRPCDHLHRLPLKSWRQFLFTALEPSVDFNQVHRRLEERLYFLPFEDFQHDSSLDKTYNVHCHWALYCDNYLEGFHIPFVHNDLNSIIDYGQYTTECYDQLVLQIGYSDGSGFSFDLPEGHPDYGKHVTAYYYWIYPNMMLNVYPWGVQLNIVKPVTPDFTKVEFIYYIHDREIFDLMQGDKLAEKTEREDEYVVESVHRGLKSRFYTTGRFSPKREKGVHYFHQLLQTAMDTE